MNEPSRATVAGRPYPSQWERRLVLHESWRIFVRPVRPDDELCIKSLLEHVTKEDLRLRFFSSIKDFSHLFLARLANLDYRTAMAFIAFDESTHETLGVVRVHADAAHTAGEYAIVLRSDLKGRGLGWALMRMMIDYSKSEGLTMIRGQVLQQNSVMLKMCRELGFTVRTDADDPGLCDVALDLVILGRQT